MIDSAASFKQSTVPSSVFRQIYPFIKGNNRPSLSLLSDFYKHYDFTEIVRICFWNIYHKIVLYYLYELKPFQSLYNLHKPSI